MKWDTFIENDIKGAISLMIASDFHKFLRKSRDLQVESCAIERRGLQSHIHILRASHEEAIVQISVCPEGEKHGQLYFYPYEEGDDFLKWNTFIENDIKGALSLMIASDFHKFLRKSRDLQVESCAIERRGLQSHIHILRASHEEAIVQISVCPEGEKHGQLYFYPYEEGMLI